VITRIRACATRLNGYGELIKARPKGCNGAPTTWTRARASTFQIRADWPYFTDLHQEFIDTVLGSMESSQDPSTQILNNPDIFQKLLAELVPIIYNEMKKTA
jgi:hypothetical protein